MSSWDTYVARLNIDGTSLRDRLIAREKSVLSERIASSPSLKSVTVNETAMSVVINSTTATNKKTFDTLPDQYVNLGDIVSWNDTSWIVDQVDVDNDLYYSGHLTQCNKILKWQNQTTYTTIERQCVFSQKTTSGVNEDSKAPIVDGQYTIILSYDSETALLNIDRRFIVDVIGSDPKVYKIDYIDTITGRYDGVTGGVLYLSLTQDTKQADDNIELMIANYITPTVTPTPDPVLLTCAITGKSTIKIGGSRTYMATFYATDGTTVDNTITAVWTLNGNTGVTMTTTGNTASLIATANSDLIGEVVTLSVVDSNGLYNPATLSVEVTAIV
jgi:hypothetical protein